MSSLPPCSTRRRRVVRDPSLGLALARRVVPGLAVALALALAAPNAVTIAAESAAGEDAGDELRASRRLRERAASLAAVTSAAPSALSRDVGQIAILEHDGSPYGRNEADGTPNYTARAALAQRFYQTHGDNYDFIVVFTNFEFETGGAIAFHSLIRNEVAGINKPVVDNGPFFGSPGRLHGFVDMAAVDRYTRQPLSARAGVPLSARPDQPGWRDTLNVMAHEIGHQWLAQPRYREATGAVSGALLGRDGAHWSYLLDSDASVMYGSDWRQRPAGDWRAERVLEGYSPLDLYLMGMTPPGRVADFTLLRNTDVDANALPREGDVIAASQEVVSLGQVVAAEGARNPRYELAPKTFRAAFVFLTSPGVDPDPEDLAAVDRLRAAFVGHFFALTGGVGLVDTTLAEVPPEPAAAAPDLDLAVAWLLAQQQADGSFEDLRGSAVRDTGTVLETLREIGLDADPYARARVWLSSAGPANSDFLLRRALALAPLLADADKQALLAAIKERQNRDGGFGLGPGYQSDALDTALALRAWAALGAAGTAASAAIDRALVHLRASRHPTGLWPTVPLGEPSTVVTAHVLLALEDHAGNAIAQGMVAPAMTALLARRNPDGGFGESPSTPYATALVLQAMLRGAPPAETVEGAVGFLQRSQATNGSWANSGYATALVLRALKGGVTPNLTVPPDFLTVTPAAPREGDVVQITARVRNTGRRPAPATIVRLFDGDPGHAAQTVGEQPIGALEPGEEATVAFDWPTLDRAGNHVLYVVADPDGAVAEAREDDNAASRSVAVIGKLPDLVIGVGDFVVTPYPPVEDEAGVFIHVTVRNAGQQKAAPTAVRVFRGDPRLGGALIGEAPLGQIAVGESATVDIPWLATAPAGSADLFALADPDHHVDESDETNNEAVLPVKVSQGIPPGPDLEIARVSIDPPVLSTIPQDVLVRVLVRNVSLEDTTSTVELRDQDTGVVYGTQSITNIPTRSATLLSFPIGVTAPGNRTFVAIADPANGLPEADENNNEGFAVLFDPGSTFDVAVGEVTPSSATLTLGEVLTVTALVSNHGTAPIAALPIVLVHAATPPVELARAFADVDPGGSTVVSLSWTTAFTGSPIPLAVVADPFDLLREIDETNNRALLGVTVVASDRPNLTASGADITFAPDPPVEGQSATVSLVVRNPSPVPAGPFVVRFYRGNPDEGGVAIGETSVPGLVAASQATVAVTWSPVDVRGAQGLFAIADADGQVDEYDEGDNRAFRPFSAVGLPDLVITAGNVSLTPAFPRAGEPVTVSAKVLNLGAQMAPATKALVIEGEGPGAITVAELTVGPLALGKAETLTATWTPTAPAGERPLFVIVDADGVVSEQDEGNNRARRVVVVQDADLYLTHPFFSPEGDGVQDDTSFAWRTQGVTSVKVTVSNSRGQLVRTLATAGPLDGSVTWDGRDEHGRLLWDGTYTFTLRSERGTLLGRRQVVLDTNHSPIHDAAGTGLVAVRNMTCALPDLWVGPAWLPAEDEALFILNYGTDSAEFPRGLLRVGVDGQFAYVAADDWYGGAYFPSGAGDDQGPPTPPLVSPDAREVLVLKDGTLYAVDLASGHPRELVSGTGSRAAWSPDGRMIVAGNRVITRDGATAGDLPWSDTGWVWSPDGQFLAAGLEIYRPDGSFVRDFSDVDIGFINSIEWRGDGKIVVSSRSGGEGTRPERGPPVRAGPEASAGRSPTPLESPGTGSSAFVLDPETGSAERLAWVDALPDRPRAFDWSPDGSKVLYHIFANNFETPYTRVSRENGTGTRQLGAFFLVPGPRKSVGSWLTFDGDFVCAGNQDVFAMVNLLNLTADLQVSRLPANNGLQLRGTASDLNLDHHQIEWATEAAPEVWHPLGAASETPVVSDDFTAWVPAVPGRYLVRLRVVDRAGNEKVRTRVVTWDRTPAIVNITQSERLISPNGDGRRDQVRFDYLVQEPARLEVRVVGPEREGAAPPVVRRFSFEHPINGPFGFEWDGRDGGGRIVPDGRYAVYLGELRFTVEVDATPPDVAWAESEPKLVLEQEARRVTVRAEVERAWHVYDANLTGWTSPAAEGSEPIYDPERQADGQVAYDERGAPRIRYVAGRIADRRETESLDTVTFMSSSDSGLSGFPLDGTTITDAPYDRLALAADDRAANASVLPVPVRAERLLLLLAVQANGQAVLVGPRAPGVMHRLAPVKAEFHLLSTTAAPDAPVFFRYVDRAGGAQKEAAVEPGWIADPKVLGLQPGHEYQAEFVQRLPAGRELHTDTFLFRLCDAAASLSVDKLPEPVPQPATDIWKTVLDAAVGEPITEARLEITGTGDNVGFHQSIRLTEDAPGSGRYLYKATTPAIEDCDAPEIGAQRAGLAFVAVITGESGRVYRGPSECLRLGIRIPVCAVELFMSQSFAGCEGKPDELLLRLDAQGPSSARVIVERGPADDPVRVAEVGLGPRVIAVDATGVPQGGLPVRARLFEPGTGVTLRSGALELVVDRTPPEGDVIEPPEGGAVCVSRDPELGMELARLTFVADDAYDPVSIGPGRFRSESGEWNPLALRCPRQDPGCSNRSLAGGTLLQREWQVDGLSSGPYEIEQTFCDRSGNRADASRRFFLNKLVPTITLESVTRAVFSPNGDGRADQTVANILLTQAMQVTAEVHAGGADGPIVETLFQDRTHLAGRHALVWNGRPGGQPVPDGVYVIVARGADACGGSGRVGARVQVDNTPPATEIAAPAVGSNVSSAVDVLGRAYDNHFTSYELSFGEGASPGSWTRFGGAPFQVGRPPEGAALLGAWAPPVVPGPAPVPYTVRVVAVDEAENESEARVTVDVGPRVFLESIAVRPPLFSPNGDERRETVTIEYRLLLPGRVTLQVRTPNSAVVRTFETAVDHGAETVAFVWDGLADGGSPAAEGDLLAWVRVEDPLSGSFQQQAALFTLDRTPPVLTLALPTEGSYVPRTALVVGSADDPRLTEWRVSAATQADVAIELGRGTDPLPGASELASLDLLSDGVHTLFLQAEDAAENRSTRSLRVTVDSVPPHAVIEMAAGAVLRKGSPTIPIRGSATDLNFEDYVLSWGPGPSPGYFVEIRRASAGGDGIVLGEWAVASLPDGDYTLRLVARDKAGHSSEAEVTVSLDGTPPEAAIAAPGEGTYVIEPQSVVGTALDAHLESWRLEMAPGAAHAAFQWSPVMNGTDSVGPDGDLGPWQPLPPDGEVTLRLTARDAAGFESSALRTVIVDTTPPAPPTGLAREIVRRTETTADVRLTWNANSEPDLAGYFLYRDDERLNDGPITSPAYADPGRPDGTYVYAVSAVDRAGNESPLASLRVRVDLTPPLVDILRPLAGARVSGTVDVRGTAFSADDFKEYRLSVGAGADPASFALLRRSTVAVSGGTLGSWTAVGAGPYVIALEAEDNSGNAARATVQVIVDNDGPGAPVLTSVVNTMVNATTVPDALTATWSPSAETDVAGYLVYRNGRVANAPGVVIGELRPFLVPAPSYGDAELPDGEHCYRVVAMDEAGNLSPPSNEICRALDNRRPHALLFEPPAGARFDYPLHLLALTPDTDVHHVLLQYRAKGAVDWIPLGAPDTLTPYEAVLDPAPLAFGEYELQAVAFDGNGDVAHADPAPEIVTVVYGDATPPLPPADVATHVDGHEVTVSWTASTATDLTGYLVYRDGEVLTKEVDVPVPITATSFTDDEVPLALHRYTVTAVDEDGNESAPGVADALVYQVVLHQPYPVTGEHAADLGGEGAEADTIVHVERDGDSIAQVAVTAAGAFQAPGVTLEPGGNVLLARGIDAAGNRSVPSDEIVLISNEAPPAVTGVSADVTDHSVDLSWDAVTDPELAGYVVRRKDVRVTPSVAQTEADSVEASEASPGYGAWNAFDGNPDTAWLPPSGSATWTVTFPTPVLVERVALQFRDFYDFVAVPRYRIEVGWEGRFVPLVTVTGNQQTSVSHALRAPFLTDGIRVAVEGDPYVGLGEVSVTRLDAVPATETGPVVFNDPDAPDGTLDYHVTAIDRYGAEGEAGSAEAAVGDTLPPGKPTGLAAAVEGSDVLLTWDRNPEPDIDHYVVIRDGVRIAIVEQPAQGDVPYRDVGRPNGTYVYQIVAVDHEPLESELSDPATAIVLNTTPPAAPVILVPTDAAHPITIDGTVTPVWGRAREADTVLLSVGGALAGATTAGPALAFQGTWPYSDGVLTPDGREVAHYGYGDLGYRVQLTPIHGGASRDVASAFGFPTVRAFSGDGQSLAYVAYNYNDGLQELAVVALDTGDQVTLKVPSSFADNPTFSPDGTQVAFISTNDRPPYQYPSTLWLYDRARGIQTTEPINPRSLTTNTRPMIWASWSPVGNRLAVVVADTSSRYQLRVYDVATCVPGAACLPQVLDDNLSTNTGPSWSADGSRLAYTRYAPSEQVRYFDFTTGTATNVTNGLAPALDPHFDRTGRWLSYLRLEGDGAGGTRTALVARDVQAGVERTVTTLLDAFDQPARLHEWDTRGYLHFSWSDYLASVYAGFEGSFAFPSVRLAPGANELVARSIDTLTALASPDSETVTVTVSESSFADLRLLPADLEANPSLPLVGQPTLLRARVRNVGSAWAGPFRAVLRVLDAGGQTLFEQAAELEGLEPEGTLALSGYWTPPAAGAYVLEAVADDTNDVVEAHEDDNAARRDFHAAATATLGLELDADRDAYAAFGTALVDVRAANGGTPFAGTLRLTVESAQGAEVAVVDEREAALGYGQSLAYGATWNAGATYAGDYRLVVRAVPAGGLAAVAEASRALRILPQVSVAGRLRADRVHVPRGDPAGFQVRVENRSANQPLADAVARVRIQVGPVVLFAQDLAVPRLLPGAVWNASTAWPGATPAGAYVAELTVVDAAGQALARAEAPFAVDAAVVVVAGSLVLQPANVLRGDATRARATVTSLGADPLSAYPFRVEVVDGPTGAVLAQAPFEADLAPGVPTTVEVPLAVAALAPGPYPVFLEGAQSLARATLHVHAPIGPPSIDSPPHGARVATDHPTLVVNNASTSQPVALTYAFELYADAALTVPVPGETGIPETPARTGWTVPTSLGEDQTYYWRARATDGFSSSPWSAVASFTVDTFNQPPFAPVPDQPAPGTAVATREVTLVVRNATDPEGDPLTYELRLATDPEMSAIVASASGIAETLSFTSWRVPVPLDEDATYWWSARVFDGFGYSPWSDPVSFTIETTNAPPSAPTLLRPAAGADVTTLTPPLVVANASDPEGDPLTYRFEIDVSPSFDSPEKQVSPPVPSGASETSWTPLALRDNTRYHWRAAASDGHTTGPFAQSRFFVDLVNEPPEVPVPIAPAAGAVVATTTPVLRARNARDPEGDALQYHFEVRDARDVLVAASPDIPEGPDETTWLVAPPLVEDQGYTWRVRAFDGALAGGWSAAVPFRVNAQPDPPTAPMLIAPAEGATVEVRRPVLIVANAMSPEGLDLTYEFELYRQAADGTLTLVDAQAGVLPGADRTSFTPTVDLPDAAYSWRARARDVHQAGPWMASAHFTVRVDEPPAPPTGLAASPGDARVTLSWNAHPEPDVTSYRVYRSLTSHGPYALRATTTTPSFLDTTVVNGTTYFYVVTALDARHESGFSVEAAATPRGNDVIEAQVRYSPTVVDGGCLLCRCGSGSGSHDYDSMNGGGGHDDCDDGHAAASASDWDARPGFAAPNDPVQGGVLSLLDAGHDDGNGGHDDDDDDECPEWLYATIELPAGLSPYAIDRHSLRLAGDVTSDAYFAQIVDLDHDHVLELRVRFPFSRVAPHLSGGVNTLRITGFAGGRPFQGSATVEVRSPVLSVYITPRTLKLGASGQWVEAKLSFESDCGRAGDVDTASLRLNGVVPVARVMSSPESRDLVVKFDRRAVEATLSPGAHVNIVVTGRVRGMPFTAVDQIKVTR